MRRREISVEDAAVLRRLGRRVAELAGRDDNLETVEEFRRLDRLASRRPLIQTDIDGGILLVEPSYRPECRGEWARGVEYGLKMRLAHREIVKDDNPLEPVLDLAPALSDSGYGVPIRHHRIEGAAENAATSFAFDPPLRTPDDLERLRPRQFRLDLEAFEADWRTACEVFEGILTVRRRGAYWWTLGVTRLAADLIGLENLMLWMYDEPEALHRLLAFITDDHLAFSGWLEAEGQLNLNNASDYIGSGSKGYTAELPAGDFSGKVRRRDTWTLIESQETVGVGPDQYAEFIFPCEKRIAEAFGRIYYGCCEPVHTRWETVRQLPALARVSVSPWCDQAFMARELAGRQVFSRKPNPTLISTERFDEAAIRADIRESFELCAAQGTCLEIIMKDVHSLAGEPGRLGRWVAIAREESARVFGPRG